VILALRGFTAPATAMCVGLSRRICQRWICRYNVEGLAGLDDLRGQQPRDVLTAEQEARMRQRLAEGPRPEDRICSLRGVDVQRILAQEFGVLRSLPAVYCLLHRLEYSYLRPRPRHRRADPKLQAAFRRALPGRVAAIAADHPDKQLRAFYQDEARFGQQGTTNVWATTGSRPTTIRQTEYQYLWVLRAVCPDTGQAEGFSARA
jgi:transposase